MKKPFLLLLAALLLLPILSSCGPKAAPAGAVTSETVGGTDHNVAGSETVIPETIDLADYDVSESESATDYVRITMKDGGVILIALCPDAAPITVKNFKKLVGRHFYDGLIFHRVIENFMIQTGDPTGTGFHGSDETIKGEFALNGVANSLSHTRGTVSMARTARDMNSASSQFFIVQKDSQRSLDGSYAAFGRVISGMDVVDRIAAVTTDVYDKPIVDQTMETVRFVTIKAKSAATEG